MTTNDEAARLFMRGTLGPVSAPLTVPCAVCSAERPYAVPEPPEPPERRWWHLRRRAEREGRCRACGAL
jgi:hypothetical protein